MRRNHKTSAYPGSWDVHQQALAKLIVGFSHTHRLESVFSDFVEMSALALSNSVDLAQFAAREERYLSIVQKYSQDERSFFPKMFAELVSSLEHRTTATTKSAAAGHVSDGDGLTDVLGQIFMHVGLGDARSGQFFTPYHMSRLSAELSASNSREIVRRNGFVRALEPAVGAGGMAIALAEVMLGQGLNYQTELHFTCVDIDPVCVYMTYLHLSLLHIPAIVVHGNFLTEEVWGMWYTPAHILGGWKRKLRRTYAIESAVGAGSDHAAPSAAEANLHLADSDLADSELPDSELPDSELHAMASPIRITEQVEGGADEVVEAEASAAASLLDLFESAADAEASKEAFLRKIDQLALF